MLRDTIDSPNQKRMNETARPKAILVAVRLPDVDAAPATPASTS
jgi:hypothetical protein